MKNLTILFVALITSVFFAGCSEKKAEEAAPVAGNARTTFTVGFDAEFPPFGFVDTANGGFKGFDLDLAKEVAKRNGWEIQLKAIDWAAKDAELNSGTIDCIWNGFTITEERKDQYTWSEPYVQNKQYILVKAGSGLKSFTQLNGKTIVAQDGSSGAEALEGKIEEAQKADSTFAPKDVKKVKDYLTAKAMLESGAVDAIALDSAVAFGFIEKQPDTFEVMEEPLMNEEYGIGFKKGNDALRDTVQATLKAMVADGTAAKIIEHWATEEKDNGGDGIDFILNANE